MPTSSWNMKRFIALHLAAFFLLFSLFGSSSLAAMWQHIDTYVFRTLNDFIRERPLQQVFWACFSIKLTDLIGAVYLVALFLLYIFEEKGLDRRKRLASLLFTLIWFEITILASKQLLTPLCEHFHLSRHSPSVLLHDRVALSTILPWLPVKDSSCFCFPADHGLIVLQWWLLFSYFAGFKRSLLSLPPTIILLLPRLISGAHWFSDLAVGSISMIAIAFAWATQTPLYAKIYNPLCRLTKVRLDDLILVKSSH